MADDAAVPAGRGSDAENAASGAADEVDTDLDGTPDDDVVGAVEEPGAPPPPPEPMSHVRLATIVGLVLVLALGGLTTWLGFRAYESHRADEQRQLFLEVGREGALNLTSVDYKQVDQDVQRILGNATGQFYDEFNQRAKPYAEVVKQVKSKSVGTVTEAGVASMSPDGADVLVAVVVTTVLEGQPEQAPRAWRMRITVQKDGDDAKVADVEFVT